jgi:hypothetical protein
MKHPLESLADTQALRSAHAKPREGACLNVMDAAAHALQAQHRARYGRVSTAPMFIGAANRSKPFSEGSTHVY